jgi:hypothetical protein
MSTNHTTATSLSARLSRLAIEAQAVADLLAAEPLSAVNAEFELGPPILLLLSVLSTLEGARYSAENFVGRRRAEDRAVARVLADGAR